jgi:hypothetical protein
MTPEVTKTVLNKIILYFGPTVLRVARQNPNTFASNRTFFVIARFSKI